MNRDMASSFDYGQHAVFSARAVVCFMFCLQGSCPRLFALCKAVGATFKQGKTLVGFDAKSVCANIDSARKSQHVLYNLKKHHMALYQLIAEVAQEQEAEANLSPDTALQLIQESFHRLTEHGGAVDLSEAMAKLDFLNHGPPDNFRSAETQFGILQKALEPLILNYLESVVLSSAALICHHCNCFQSASSHSISVISMFAVFSFQHQNDPELFRNESELFRIVQKDSELIGMIQNDSE